MSQCTYTGITPEILRPLVYDYLHYVINLFAPSRASYLSPDLYEHAVHGRFTQKVTEFWFEGFFKYPQAVISSQEIEIMYLTASMYDSGKREFVHPHTGFTGVPNRDATGFTMADLKGFVPPPVAFKESKSDRDRAEAIVQSAFVQMCNLDHHTALAWAREYLSTSPKFDYQNVYNQSNIKEAVRWGSQRKAQS